MERGSHPGRPAPARGTRAGLSVFILAGWPAVAPAAPAGNVMAAPARAAADSRPGAIRVEWASVAGAEGYHVYRSLSAGGPYAMLATAPCAPKCEFQDAGIVSGQRYHYVIRAYDREGREGPSSLEAVAMGDTVPPSAEIRFPAAAARFSGRGPGNIGGIAVDAATGVAAVDLSLRRIDTGEWWTGAAWAAGQRTWLPASVEGAGPTRTWTFDAATVAWAQATAYRIRLRVRDGAGFELDPADAATIFVDAPAILTVSVAAAPGSVTVGQPVHVTVLIANTGGSAARDVQPMAPVPETRPGAKTAAQPVGSPAAALVPRLSPGEFATFSWTFSATAPGLIAFTAGAAGIDAPSGKPATVSPGMSNEVAARLPARLESEVTVHPPNARIGTNLSIRLRVTNAGQAEATVTGASIAAAQPGLTGPLAGPDAPAPFRLREGESRTLVWTATATQPGTAVFTAQVSGYDETSGARADARPMTSRPAGIASEPAGLRISASSDAVETGQPVGVSVLVTDQAGTPVPGSPVDFRLLAGEGTFDTPKAVTDDLGVARAVLTMGKKPGVAAVSARSGSLLASFSVEGILPGGAASVLSRNFFDPERGETVDVQVRLPRTGRVRVRVFTLGGEVVAELANGSTDAGDMTWTWNGRRADKSLANNGVYFISVEAAGTLMSRRVSVLRRP